MTCAEFEALLPDYLDGLLPANETVAFEVHRQTCGACAQLLEEASRGGEWLRFLEPQPEAPADLVARILAQTSGVAAPLLPQAAVAGIPAAVIATGWLPGLERRAAQSRWMMTAAMAFFSIAFTLNLTGVRLTGFRLGDLTPAAIVTGISRQFYAADAQVMRYYDNLRFVYELESRVREIKQNVASPDSGTAAPPAAGDTKPAAKPKKDGSARKALPEDSLPEARPDSPMANSVLASLRREGFAERPHSARGRIGHLARPRAMDSYPGNRRLA